MTTIPLKPRSGVRSQPTASAVGTDQAYLSCRATEWRKNLSPLWDSRLTDATSRPPPRHTERQSIGGGLRICRPFGTIGGNRDHHLTQATEWRETLTNSVSCWTRQASPPQSHVVA